MKLAGRAILITGGSQGLGKEIARACLRAGGNIFLCARNEAPLQETLAELRGELADGQQLFGEIADVANPADVDRIVKAALAAFGRLDGLVNNAGIYGPKGLIEEIDWQQWLAAIEINLNGTVLPCRAVMPIFRAQGYGKIVNLSGGGATAPMPRFSAYAASKAAVIRFTETLAEETRDCGIDINAIAPGALNTRLLDEVIAAGPDKVGELFYQRAMRQQTEGGASLSHGCELATFLLSAESDGISGRLLSAIWDLWEKLPEHREKLQKSDIYTLRRIVPKDRGEDWGDR